MQEWRTWLSIDLIAAVERVNACVWRRLVAIVACRCSPLGNLFLAIEFKMMGFERLSTIPYVAYETFSQIERHGTFPAFLEL